MIVCIRNIKTIRIFKRNWPERVQVSSNFRGLQNVFQNRKRATISPHPSLFPNQTYRIISKKKKKKKEEREKKSNLLSFRISYIYILPCSDFCNETRGQCSKLIFISLDGESGELSRKGFENDICRYPCLLFCNFSLLCFIISPLLSLSLSRLVRAGESPWIFRDTIRTRKAETKEKRERERGWKRWREKERKRRRNGRTGERRKKKKKKERTRMTADETT